MADPLIQDVTDTAVWVAYYRARESKRPDALFDDPLAGKLVQGRVSGGYARMMDARYVEWSVVIRTRIIDEYVRLMVAEGVDTVLNLGAGLDTRPYRLDLPTPLRWIEVDFPKIIALKSQTLADEKPRCRLERVSLDLSNEAERARFFSTVNAESRNVLVITEGVTPYLSNDAVASLARALRAQPTFRHFVTDYMSPVLARRLRHPRRRRQMGSAQFIFDPADWNAFYVEQGWKVRELKYIGETSVELGRHAPLPWPLKLLMRTIVPKEKVREFRRMNGYALLEQA